MRSSTLLRFGFALLLAVSFATACFAAAGMSFRAFSVEGKSLQGTLNGEWEWTGGVTVKGQGLTMTCDSLKLWPSTDGREAERAEATGKVKLEGSYTGSDGIVWEVKGRSDSAGYVRKDGQAVLRGAVSFQAKNTQTGATMSATAEKLIYNVTTKQFRFERGDTPVRIEWQEPIEEGKSQK